MRIVHYALGLPPYRSGGLTEYVQSLAVSQVKAGQDVFVLWPGEMKLFHRDRLALRRRVLKNKLVSAELINPLPVPLMEGVCEPDAFREARDPESVRYVLDELRPDVLHIHTLMGLPRELVDEAAARQIPMVFTTHDYYPFSPTVTMYDRNHIADPESMTEEDYARCSAHALSLRKIFLLQTPLYRALKDTKMMQKRRREYRAGKAWEESRTDDAAALVPQVSGYRELREYYIGALQKMRIHANSEVAAEVYRRFLPNNECIVLPITNARIKDYRSIRDAHHPVNLAFLASCEAYKGFGFLLQVLDGLWEETHDFLLHIYKPTKEERPYLVKHESYNGANMRTVLSDIHAVIVPSLWLETFGFVTAEAMSLGIVPVVSDHVGASCLIRSGETGYVLPEDVSAWRDCLYELVNGPEKLREISSRIYEMPWSFDIADHAKEVEKLYH